MPSPIYNGDQHEALDQSQAVGTREERRCSYSSNLYYIADNDLEQVNIPNKKHYFQINWMSMSDAETGNALWKHEWEHDTYNLTCEQEARIPSSVLECAIVSREINFSSNEEISNLKLRQTFLLNEHCIEEWFFTFGYVIPNSTNTWQQVIKSAGKGKMMSPEILSGNVIIDTKFYDEESVIFENRMRVYYI